MPVFDFNNTSEQTEMVQSECTYTVFYSDETEATPEKPMLVLDNKERQWKHHSCDTSWERATAKFLLAHNRILSGSVFPAQFIKSVIL